MAYKRKYGKKRFTKKRRGGGKRGGSTRSLAQRALKVAKKVSRVMRKEKNEYFCAEDFDCTTTTPQQWTINNVERGTEEDAHMGNDYTGLSCTVWFDTALFTGDPTSQNWCRRFRVLVYRIKQNPTGASTPLIWSEVLDPTKASSHTGFGPTYYSSTDADKMGLNRNNLGLVHVIKDFIIKIDQVHPQDQRKFTFRYPYQMRNQDFTAADDYMYKNMLKLYIIPLDFVPAPAEGQARVSWHSKFSFYE